MARRNSAKSKSKKSSKPQSPALPPQQQQAPQREARDDEQHDEGHDDTARQQQQQQQQASTDHDPFADKFFDQSIGAPNPEAWDLAWDDADERPRIAPEKRRAMVATAVIFGSFAVLLGSFTVYSQFIMPTPVALGASSGTFTLPTPIQMESPVPRVAPRVAPAAAEAMVATEARPIEEPATPTNASVLAAPIERHPRHRDHEAHRSTAHAGKSADSASLSEPLGLGARAMHALNAGQPSEARHLAQQAVLSHPERPDGWIVLGAAHDALGDHAAALTAYADCSARAMGPRVATCRALAR